MNEAEILLSRLAIDQIAQLHPTTGRALLDALTTLAHFPESSPRVPQTDYEGYRQVVAKGYRAIYRYFPERHQVCIYCVLHTRRPLPPSEFLQYQLFN